MSWHWPSYPEETIHLLGRPDYMAGISGCRDIFAILKEKYLSVSSDVSRCNLRYICTLSAASVKRGTNQPIQSRGESLATIIHTCRFSKFQSSITRNVPLRTHVFLRIFLRGIEELPTRASNLKRFFQWQDQSQTSCQAI